MINFYKTKCFFFEVGNSSTCCENTEVEFRLKGIPFEHKVQNKGTLNNSFIDDVSLFNQILIGKKKLFI